MAILVTNIWQTFKKLVYNIISFGDIILNNLYIGYFWLGIAIVGDVVSTIYMARANGLENQNRKLLAMIVILHLIIL